MRIMICIAAMFVFSGALFCQSARSLAFLDKHLSVYEKLDKPQSQKVIPGSRVRLFRFAEFPGGTDSLEAFVNERFVYPELAREYGIDGFLYVQLTIDIDGQIVASRIRRGLGYGYEAALLEVIEQMPPWTPTIINGEPVKWSVIVPVWFRLR